MIAIVLFIASVIALAASQAYDISETDKGIKAGVAVEGNSSITYFFGNKPTAGQLYLHNTLLSLPMAALAIIGVVTGNPGFLGVGCGPMVGYAIKHIQGALAWKKLLAAKK